jgi:predicted transcriptional regulator
MLRMREDGMSNRDIAKSLDISYQTVLKYIGKQGKRMESLAGFRDAPVKKREEKQMATIVPKFNPKPVKEVFAIEGEKITLNSHDKILQIDGMCNSATAIPYKDLPKILEFLEWAMRERMEADVDEQVPQP